MFSCIVHGWNSNESPCPACPRTITTGGDLPVEFMSITGQPSSDQIAGMREALEKMCVRAQELFDEKKSNPRNKGNGLSHAFNKMSFALDDANKILNTQPSNQSPSTGEQDELIWIEMIDKIVDRILAWIKTGADPNCESIYKELSPEYHITRK